MKIGRGLVATVATALVGTAMAVAAPGTANAADPCQLGWSNVGPRSCAMTQFNSAPTWTLGNGVCVGMLTAGGTAYDGPLPSTHYGAPGSTHSIELRLLQGFSPLGDWAPSLLACDVTAIIDWHNLDTGQRGSVTRFLPAWRTGSHPDFVYVHPGPGRVALTVRTDRPSIPATTEVFVP